MPGTLQSGGAAFASTHWSLVLQCGEDGGLAQGDADPDKASAALEELCRSYWPPIYTFVRRRGYSPADAQDLVQGFFLHILESGACNRADPARGRFRTFLLGALKNFLANAHDYAHALKRGGAGHFVPLDEHLAEAEAAISDQREGEPHDAERLFEQRWASALVTRAWADLRASAVAEGKGQLLDALRPYIAGGSTPAPGQDEIAQRLGLPLATVRTHVYRLRARFRDALRSEVARTVPAPDDVDEELRHLRHALIAAAS